jgi:hypothetical protein
VVLSTDETRQSVGDPCHFRRIINIRHVSGTSRRNEKDFLSLIGFPVQRSNFTVRDTAVSNIIIHEFAFPSKVLDCIVEPA